MKVFSPKALSVSIAVITVAFVSGLAVASHPQIPTKTQAVLSGTYKTTADTSTVQAPAAPTVTVTTTPTTTSSTSTSPASMPASSNTSSATSSTQTTTQTTTTPAVTAVSATMGDWTDPVPADSIFYAAGSPLPTVVRYRYCTWTYSDGSSQQKTYDELRSTVSGGMQTEDGPYFDCTLANAPAAN